MLTEAERYDTKFNVKLCGFQSQLEASYVFSYTEDSLSVHDNIYIYIYIYIWKISGKIDKSDTYQRV